MASKHYHIKLNFDSDREVIDRIESKENKNDYIRRLVLSDIAADYLQGMIKLEKDKYIDTDMVYQDRVDFYNNHCPALNNLDSSKNHCEGCEFNVHYTDVDGLDKTTCSLEDAWRIHCSKKLYDVMGGAKRNYPAEFKGLMKAKLNSVYGRMLKDPFKDDVIDNMLDNNSNALESLDVNSDG